MGSKHFVENENISSINNKRFKNSTEEITNSKKIMPGGRTLAQKRLEKIKQQLKDTAKPKEVCSPSKASHTHKGKNLYSPGKDEASQSAAMAKKEYSAINKGRNKRGKTLAQGRLERFQNQSKKEELVYAISSQSKKIDKKIKRESINSMIKPYTNKLSESSDSLNVEKGTYNKAAECQSNMAKYNEISKNNYNRPTNQTSLILRSNLNNKNNVIPPRCHSNAINYNEVNRNNYIEPICHTNEANIINKNKLISQRYHRNRHKPNEINKSNYTSPTCQTNVAKSNISNRDDLTSQRCLSDQGKRNETNRTDFTPSTYQTNLPKCQEIIKNIKVTRNKRNVSNEKSVKETSQKINNSVVKNISPLANLYKRKSVSDTADNISIINKKRASASESIERKIKKNNTIKKAIIRLNEVNSSRILDQAVFNEDSINVTNDFVEDMEWEPICEDISLELKSVRNAVINDKYIEMMDWQESVLEIDKVPDNNIIHYVIDSNIFISSLEIVKKIKEKDAESIIVIPWQVLKELDSLKKGPPQYTAHVATCARQAVQYLLSCQTEHTSNVVWQTQKQANQPCPDFSVEIADDHIIKCCFQLNSSGHNVVLLSNDKNLRLKASVHKIATISDEKLLEKMAFKINKSDKLPLERPPISTKEIEIYAHKFTEVFKTFLNNIIELYLRSIYGNMWLWYIPEKPPISLITLIELIKNFSSSIFNTSECQKYINQINSFFKKQTYSKLTINEFDGIIRICLRLANLLPQDKDYLEQALQFEENLAFLKAREPTESIPYKDLCCKLTVLHFDTFEALLVGYCLKVAECLRINFTHSVISERRYILPEKFDLKLINHYMNILKVISANLERISKTHPQQIFVHTKAIISLYNTLITCVEDHDTFFTIEDVVEFCKNDCIRSNLPEALRIFHGMTEFLGTAKNIALNKKLI